MRTRKLHLGLLVAATSFLIMFSGCTKDENLTDEMNSPQPMLKSGNTPSANGQGSLIADDTTRHFAFHAHTMPDGTVQGSGLTIRPGRTTKFSIDCMVVDGNVAVMSGYVTQITYPNQWFYVGAPVAFRVVDNGEGGSNPDEITMLYASLAIPPYPCDCYSFPYEPLIEIINGNIQVNP